MVQISPMIMISPIRNHAKYKLYFCGKRLHGVSRSIRSLDHRARFFLDSGTVSGVLGIEYFFSKSACFVGNFSPEVFRNIVEGATNLGKLL